MRLSYLGHAGFVAETDEWVVVTDPWLSEDGAFDAGWMQFPRNHHLAGMARRILEDRSRMRLLYLSHEHRDHFDPAFLNTLPKDITIVGPRFTRPAYEHEVRQLGFEDIRFLEDGEMLHLPYGYVRMFVSEQGLNLDSALLIKGDGVSFLDMNDCKIHDRLPAIFDEEGEVDVFTAQYSGAVWHPVCYDYPSREYAEISTRKKLRKFEACARAIEAMQPKIVLSSAGPACFLDPELFHLNFQENSIFPHADEFFRWLENRLGPSVPKCIEMMPGEALDPLTGEVLGPVAERVTAENRESYLHEYAVHAAKHFQRRQQKPTPTEVEAVFDDVKKELALKLENLDPKAKTAMPLYVGITDLPDRWMRIDFSKRHIQEVPQIDLEPRMTMTVAAVDVARVLQKHLSWEALFLSLRVRLSRAPDIYDPLLHAFVAGEVDDMPRLSLKPEEQSAKEVETTIIKAGHRLYTINRVCPHQGADLAGGWVEEDRYLVCPRHGWRFDLQNGGACSENDATICAKEMGQPAQPMVAVASAITDEAEPAALPLPEVAAGSA